MSHEYQQPKSMEVAKTNQPLGPDSFEADTTLVAGTRKLIAVMFWLLKIDIPDQESIEAHIKEVAND